MASDRPSVHPSVLARAPVRRIGATVCEIAGWRGRAGRALGGRDATTLASRDPLRLLRTCPPASTHRLAVARSMRVRGDRHSHRKPAHRHTHMRAPDAVSTMASGAERADTAAAAAAATAATTALTATATAAAAASAPATAAATAAAAAVPQLSMAPPGTPLHRFSANCADVRIEYIVLKMDGTLYIWMGDAGTLSSLAVAMPWQPSPAAAGGAAGRRADSVTGTMIVGMGPDTGSLDMARRLGAAAAAPAGPHASRRPLDRPPCTARQRCAHASRSG